MGYGYFSYYFFCSDEYDDEDEDAVDEEEAVPGNSKRKALGLCKGILMRCFPSFRSKASFNATLKRTAAPRASNGPVICGGTPGICCGMVGGLGAREG
jgi:hypothetical protein